MQDSEKCPERVFLGFPGMRGEKKNVFAIFSDSWQPTHKYIEMSRYCNYLLVENVFSIVYFKMVNFILSVF